MTKHKPNSSLLTPHSSLATDVLIIGAGPVGMTLALALADSPLRVLLVDSQPRGNWHKDPRSLALSHGSRQLLERLGAWDASAGTAIEEIHISQKNGFGHSLIDASDYGIPALGYVMSYSKLAAALDAQLPPELRLAPCTVEHIESTPHEATVSLNQQGQTRRITTRLIVHAEGSSVNDPDVRVCPYNQQAIVAEVRPSKEAGHAHRAWERFTADGPLALLPHDEGYSVVFTVPTEKAQSILELDDECFIAALRAQLGERLDFASAGPRSSFPLALRIRSPLTTHRQVWIGNAAQTLHPVSGQGFNLGLRDAWELAEILHAQTDAGNATGLTAYSRGRQLDRCTSTAFTDGIVSLFSNDFPPLRLARGLGLLALELCPPLRHFVAKRMIWGARAW